MEMHNKQIKFEYKKWNRNANKSLPLIHKIIRFIVNGRLLKGLWWLRDSCGSLLYVTWNCWFCVVTLTSSEQRKMEAISSNTKETLLHLNFPILPRKLSYGPLNVAAFSWFMGLFQCPSIIRAFLTKTPNADLSDDVHASSYFFPARASCLTLQLLVSTPSRTCWSTATLLVRQSVFSPQQHGSSRRTSCVCVPSEIQ